MTYPTLPGFRADPAPPSRPGRPGAASLLLTACVLAGLGGCAGSGAAGNESTEQLLAAAGFSLYLPRNGQEESNLKALPQRQVLEMPGAAKPTFLYADHDTCDCIYVGGREQFDQFNRLVQLKRQADASLDDSRYRMFNWSAGGMYGYGMGGMGGMYGLGGAGVMGGYW